MTAGVMPGYHLDGEEPPNGVIYMLKDPMVVAQKVSGYMATYAELAGREAWVIGVSGGIDSAVSFRLA